MKIRVLGIRGLPATYSGLETIMGELAPRWVEAGHEVIVYCRKAVFKERPDEWRGVKLVYLPSIEHKAFSTLSHSFLATLHASFSPSDAILYGMQVMDRLDGSFVCLERLLLLMLMGWNGCVQNGKG